MKTWTWKRTSVASRVAISLVLLSTFTVMFARPIGLLPDAEQLENRAMLAVQLLSDLATMEVGWGAVSSTISCRPICRSTT